MPLVRLFLLVVGLASLATGFVFLIAPEIITDLAELALPSATATIEIRGFYGGQLLGLGVVILLGVFDRRFVLPALVLVVAPLGGTALGRLIGAAAEQELPPIMAALLAAEIGTAVLGAVLLKRELVTSATMR